MHSNTDDVKAFIKQHESKISAKVDLSTLKASILPDTEEGLKKAGEIIREGRLVSFPTETVYGLAANAFDETAVKRIYETKRRPLSDPVIVHVTAPEAALEFLDIEEKVKDMFLFLVSKFWPGPLTCVLKADLSKIPSIVTANTGYVGVRFPKAKIAQDFINAAQRPIAAPSANLFSHVSPTSPAHVFNDFFDQDVTVINGENCEFGIESTVMKVYVDETSKKVKLLIFRIGSVSEQALRAVLRESADFKDIEIAKFKKDAFIKEDVNSEAPGMLLKHYSPYLETFLLNVEKDVVATAKQEVKFVEGEEVDKKSMILIDFGGVLADAKGDFLKYFSLSESGNLREAMSKLYDVLREAENVKGGNRILILNLSTHFENAEKELAELPEFLETVYDKSFRSASGKTVNFDLKTKKFFE